MTDHQTLTEAQASVSNAVLYALDAHSCLAYEFAVAAVNAFQAGKLRDGLACAELAGDFARKAAWPTEERASAIAADWSPRGAA